VSTTESRASMEQEPDSSDTEPMEANDSGSLLRGQDANNEDGIGEFDDGKTGKLTLSILLAEGLIEPGDGVMSIDYLGQSFKGDLLSIGKIRSVETGLIFNNPSAWAIYCKKIINPAKKSGCGWASIKYRGRKMDYFKTIWLKRKAQREAEAAKNEAAQALTALSNSAAVIPLLAPVFQPPPAASSLSVSSSPAKVSPTPAPPPVVVMRGSVAENVVRLPVSQESERYSEVPPPQQPPPQRIQEEEEGGKPMVIRHQQIVQAMSRPRDYHVELESFLMDGKMQPFTVSGRCFFTQEMTPHILRFYL
jgi:Restriction Enzyme Adenine Methylase Associated